MTSSELERLFHADAAFGPGVCRIPGNAELSFASITEDSRAVAEGTLFVAAQGEQADGHDFVPDAKARGAVGVLGELSGIDELAGLPYITVPHARRALGIVAHALVGDPSRAMTVVGVTGTNGKSSTVALIQHVFEACDLCAANFGTLGYALDGETLSASHTTPSGEALAKLFGKARDAGCTHVSMEISSHALEQERVAGIDFDVGAFTNLTQDHLDYHGSLEAYRTSKLRLFEGIQGPDRFTVVNRADPAADHFINASAAPCVTFGEGGDCVAVNISHELQQTRFDLQSPWGEAQINLSLLGLHNVANALCAITVCGGLGLPLEGIVSGIESLANVPGRFERIDEGQDFQVIVDYAHTEDGLRNVLHAARELCSKRVLVVFGCGGDRDRGKRPKMAAAVAELADFSVLTSDNPRSEDPERILVDVERGMLSANKEKECDYLVIADREEAITRAIAMAKPGDFVMIAGKGHEDYQIIGTDRIHFDDREVARTVLSEMSARSSGGK